VTRRPDETTACHRGQRRRSGHSSRSTHLRLSPKPGTVCRRSSVVASCGFAVLKRSSARSRSRRASWSISARSGQSLGGILTMGMLDRRAPLRPFAHAMPPPPEPIAGGAQHGGIDRGMRRRGPPDVSKVCSRRPSASALTSLPLPATAEPRRWTDPWERAHRLSAPPHRLPSTLQHLPSG
jgi:hypothetical protein